MDRQAHGIRALRGFLEISVVIESSSLKQKVVCYGKVKFFIGMAV